ncbi:unnamed protein product [Symbiodinium sp. CCMP2456]|nr:unnamed protein product [Symbiodinium sp. CCMP2456]
MFVLRTEKALTQFVPYHPAAQIERFLFSEHFPVDMRQVDEAINEDETRTHAFVLLIITGNSSYLWFNPSHCPRNVEPCATLKQRLGSRITFVVCPTTREAKASWSEHQRETQHIFREFSSHPVEVWNDYDPYVTPEMIVVLQIVVVVAVLMYGCWTQMQLHRWSQTLQKTNQHLQARSEFLDYRNQTLQNESKLLDSEKQKLQHDMAEMEKQNQTLQSHHKLIDREMAEMNQTLQKKSKFLHSERQKLQNDMAEMNKDIAEIDKWNQTLQERPEADAFDIEPAGELSVSELSSYGSYGYGLSDASLPDKQPYMLPQRVIPMKNHPPTDLSEVGSAQSHCSRFVDGYEPCAPTANGCCSSQLTIFAAPLLAQRFASEGAEVDLNLGHVRLAGTAAVLGWPRYGDICEGPLRLFDVETNCTLSRAVPPQTTPWIAVLRLGRNHGCPSLARALRSVEADTDETLCGAVVLEADAALPELLPGDLPASFVPVLRRPAASVGLAAALQEADAEGLSAIRGALRWGQPLLVESLPSQSLPIEFWLNPASASGRKQLRAAAVALRPLRQHLTWQIYWPVTWRANSSEKATEFCISGSDLTNFDAGGFVCMAFGKASDSAAALLEEAAHLRCVEDGDFEKAMRWEYLERTFAACEDSDGTASCSARQLQALGAKRCVPNNFTAFVLSEANKPRPWPMGLRGESPDFAVRIAGWAFGGMPEAEAIFEAVCAVLRLPGPAKPSACGEVWHWRAPGWFLRRVPLWPHSCLSLLLSFLLPLCWPAFKKRTLGRIFSCCRARTRS